MPRLNLADIDGTTPGVTVLVHVNLNEAHAAGPQHIVFREGLNGCTNPQADAVAWWDAHAAELPGHRVEYIGNERAAYLNHAAIAETMGNTISPERWLTLINGAGSVR